MANANLTLPSLNQDTGWFSYQQHSIERWHKGQRSMQLDYIAEEVPISLIYNTVPHAVMLATPTNIEEFALGFSITEGIIQHPEQLLSTRIFNRANGIEVQMTIAAQCVKNLTTHTRQLTGRTSCGLCGTTSLQHALRQPNAIDNALIISTDEVTNALKDLQQYQKINQLTGSVHAAAFVTPTLGIVMVREDVGRHNALDKLIGGLLRTHTPTEQGFLLITSRASFEMVQKAAFIGITILIAISAPTGLAVRLAEEVGLTLIGFARTDQHVIYTHPHRLTHST